MTDNIRPTRTEALLTDAPRESTLAPVSEVLRRMAAAGKLSFLDEDGLAELTRLDGVK